MRPTRIIAICFFLVISSSARGGQGAPQVESGATEAASASASEAPVLPVTGPEALTPSPSLTPTILPSSPTPSPTPPMLAARAQTQTAPFAVEDCSTAPREYAPSLDATVLAVTCPQGVLKVISPQWTAPLNLNFADVYSRDHDAPFGLLRPLAWSNDSQYLYFVPAPLSSSIARLADGAALLRLDVLNNRVRAIVSGADYRF